MKYSDIPYGILDALLGLALIATLIAGFYAAGFIVTSLLPGTQPDPATSIMFGILAFVMLGVAYVLGRDLRKDKLGGR